MSVLTTQPELLTSASARSKAHSVPGDSHTHPGDGAGTHWRPRKVGQDLGGTGAYTVCFRRPSRIYECLTTHRRLQVGSSADIIAN
jgi:hypothetical protein